MAAVRSSVALMIGLVGVTYGQLSYGQAYCALRDPVASIYELFPEADSYQSIVKIVGNDAKNWIAERLDMSLHFNELGRHTVYVAMNAGAPVGIVHARSESDRWGLTEIVWAFDLDLRIVDFRFQRTRNTARRGFEESAYRRSLKGKTYAELNALVVADADFSRGEFDSQNIRDLAALVTKSALKTMLVTTQVWDEELTMQRRIRDVQGYFGIPIRLEAISAPYTTNVLDELGEQLLADEASIERSHVAMYAVYDDDDAPLGYSIDSPWQSGPTRADIRWLLTDTGRVLNATTTGDDSPPQLNDGLMMLRGFEPMSASECANSLELSALELGLLARHAQNRRLP